MTTATALIAAATARLAAAAVDDPAADARRLLAFAMGREPARLTFVLADPVAPEVAARFDALIARRALREPVAQITGLRAFWKAEFRVTRDTLDPRPDTETLVAAALEQPFRRVLDLGTGTGCILMSLLMDRPEATGLATDISPAALAVAQDNALRLGLGARAELILSDWFGAVTGRFDLIVSNPPYIAADEMAALAPEVRDWEPHGALTPGGDGLAPYRIITEGAGAHLGAGGRLMVEIGPTQGAAVAAMFTAAGFDHVAVLRDFDGRDRVVAGHWQDRAVTE